MITGVLVPYSPADLRMLLGSIQPEGFLGLLVFLLHLLPIEGASGLPRLLMLGRNICFKNILTVRANRNYLNMIILGEGAFEK